VRAALIFTCAAVLVASCHREPQPAAPTEPSPGPAPPSTTGPTPPVASTPPDAGPPNPAVEARKRRALDLLQGKVPESELKVDSVGE